MFCVVYAGKINQEEVAELMKESIKMLEFSHPNVMGLLGVCVDAGPTPYVVLPFMSGGSLYDYLKTNRKTLVLAKEDGLDEDEVSSSFLAYNLYAQSFLIHWNGYYKHFRKYIRDSF